MYQPYWGFALQSVVSSAQQTASDVSSSTPVCEDGVSDCFTRLLCEMLPGLEARLAKWTDDIAFQDAMFQSQTPYRVCAPLAYVSGVVAVNGIFRPVPKSMRIRGVPWLTRVAPTITLEE